MLVLDDLHKSFRDRRAVDGVSLSIAAGDCVGIIGRSGAGKSTLLRLINRLIEPSRGRISFDGRDVSRLSGRDLRLWRASCAMIFQQFNLIDRMDVLTNVLVGGLSRRGFVSSMARRFGAQDRATAIRALDRLDMAPQALQRAGTLSGGQQQRVAIARALVQNPRILLADEPIASLDPANAVRVMDALRRINHEDGITVLVNLHTIDTARKYCTRVIAMRDGRVRFDGPPHALTSDVLHDIYGDESFTDAIDDTVTSTTLIRAPRTTVPA